MCRTLVFFWLSHNLYGLQTYKFDFRIYITKVSYSLLAKVLALKIVSLLSTYRDKTCVHFIN